MRAEAEGVPPRDRENSDTGPSYIPLGTALSTASCGTNKSRGGEGIEEARGTGEERRTGKNITAFSCTKVTKSTPVSHYM